MAVEVLLLCFGIVMGQTNLATNPSFETDALAGAQQAGSLTGWTSSANNLAGFAQCAYQSGHFCMNSQTGNQIGFVPDPPCPAGTKMGYLRTQTVGTVATLTTSIAAASLSASTWYSVSYKMRSQYGTFPGKGLGNGNDLSLLVSLDDGATYSTIVYDPFVATTVWVTRYASFQTPSSLPANVYLRFQVTTPYQGPMLLCNMVDDVQVYQGAAGAACNSDTACDDSDPCTDDFCRQPSSTSAYCDHVHNWKLFPCLYSYPSNITFNATVRDVRVSHPDFEESCCNYLECGMLMDVSDSTYIPGKPQYRGVRNHLDPFTASSGMDMYLSNETRCDDQQSTVAESTKGKAVFESWFQDEPLINVRVALQITLTLMPPPAKPGTYMFKHDATNGQWFPTSQRGWGNDILGSSTNFAITTEVQMSFRYRGDEQFYFAGDDDLWVLINNTVALDMGGTHSQKTKNLNLAYGGMSQQLLGLQIGQRYPLSFLNAERHTTQSNLFFMTTIAPANTGPVCSDASVSILVGVTIAPSLSALCFDAEHNDAFHYIWSVPSAGTFTNSGNTSFTYTATVAGTFTVMFNSADNEFAAARATYTIIVTEVDTSTPAPPTEVVSPPSPNGLSAGAIAGIVVGAVAAVGIAAAIALFCFIKSRLPMWAADLGEEVDDKPIDMNPLYDDKYKRQTNAAYGLGE